MYKDDWNAAYQEGTEKGMDDKTAAQYADDKAYDIMAMRADALRLVEKYGTQI